jgi:NADP-dependent 3-hydroxy acid dehydrogenase YdfG
MPENTQRVLLITGASSGIGAATARRAAAAGYRLVLTARREERLQALSGELGGEQQALPLSCDVRAYACVEAAVERALAHFGRLDAVFANAGIGGPPGGFSGADPAGWHDMLLTNVFGVAATLRACLAPLKERRGHVLLTGSAAGRTIIPGSLYGASKWAVSAIGYNLREELRGTGVRVTLIEPGYVNTPLLKEPPPQAMDPGDIANAVLYALSQPPGVDVNEILIRPTPPAE